MPFWKLVRMVFFEVLAVLLILGSMFFFKETLDYLARRDYIAALLVMIIGVAVIGVGKEMARLALVQRD
jgi:ABC-type transport system involved in cytochrome bd biosynthesis fused ATPase/permease subunit